jgi:hypothetical protein
MVALSIFEELLLPDPVRLIPVPAVIGWLGTLGSLVYLLIAAQAAKAAPATVMARMHAHSNRHSARL